MSQNKSSKQQQNLKQRETKESSSSSRLEMSSEITDGIYCNFASVINTSTEFVLDFIHLVPGAPKAKVKARILITPETARRFIRDLQESMEDHDKHHNKVNSGKDVLNYPINFNNVEGEA